MSQYAYGFTSRTVAILPALNRGNSGVLLAEGERAARLGGATVQSYSEGSFSITDWSAYPKGLPRPTGPVRILKGAEYATARQSANEANAAIRAAFPELRGSGLHIHEVKPVKFGGSPTDAANKTLVPWQQHVGPEGVHTQFWTPLLKWATGG